MRSSTPMCFGAVLRRSKLRSSDGEPPESTTTMCKLSGLKRFMGPQMFRRKRKAGNLNRRQNIEDGNTLSNNETDVSVERSGHGVTEQVPAGLSQNEPDRSKSLLSRDEHKEGDGDLAAATSSARILEPANVFADNGETPRFNENEGDDYIHIYRSTGHEARTSEACYVVRCIAGGTARLSGTQDCSGNNKREVSCEETRRSSRMEMGVSSSTRPVRKQELALNEGESKVQKQPKGSLPLNDDDFIELDFTKPLERQQGGGVSSSDDFRGQEHEVRKLGQNEWGIYDSDEVVYYRLDRAGTNSATLPDTDGYQNLPATHSIECRAYENVDGVLCATPRGWCVNENENVNITVQVLNYVEVKVSTPASSPAKTLTESRHTNYTVIDVLGTTTFLEMTEQNKTRLSRIKKN